MSVTPLSSETSANTGGTSVTVGGSLGGVTAGNLLVVQYVWDNTSGTTTAPSGWTLKETTARGGALGCSSEIWYKIADSGDASSPSFTFSNSSGTKGRLSIIKIQAGRVLSPIPQSSSAQNNVANPMQGTAVTPTIADSLILFFTTTLADLTARTVSGYAITTSNPSTWTELYDTGNSNFVSVSMAWATRPETTSTGTPTANQEVSGADYLMQIIIVAGAYASSTVDTSTILDTFLKTFNRTITETVSTLDTLTAVKGRFWGNVTKNISSWINPDKS